MNDTQEFQLFQTRLQRYGLGWRHGIGAQQLAHVEAYENDPDFSAGVKDGEQAMGHALDLYGRFVETQIRNARGPEITPADALARIRKLSGGDV